MNWVVDPSYLASRGYPDEDKLFGHFGVRAGGADYRSDRDGRTALEQRGDARMERTVSFPGFEVSDVYELDGDALRWRIALRNTEEGPLFVESFYVWASLAYVMFRDPDVRRNIDHSCAVFPSVSRDFGKLACVRRSGKGPHLGLYATSGSSVSMGTYCRFENLFFHNVSPSLDGVLFHQWVLIGTGTDDPSAAGDDWIYMRDARPLTIAAKSERSWEFALMPFEDRRQFYENALRLGHPVIECSPAVPSGGEFHASFRWPRQLKPARVWLEARGGNGPERQDVTGLLAAVGEERAELRLRLDRPGERKLTVQMEDGKTDCCVFNVMEPVRSILETRADYICRRLYAGEDGEAPHAFLPLSNQGESLGKIAFVLMKNAVGARDREQIRKAENSAVRYIRPKWFVSGDLARPAKLYGDFYRIFDLDYIAHVFYLLSRFGEDELIHHAPQDYLRWAAEVMALRLDERMHEDERERRETRMLGVYTLFIRDLLRDLKRREDMADIYGRLSALWNAAGERLRRESADYLGAVTEHFYDNAGFGPAFEALCLSGHMAEAERYGELLLANIGFSNDFRAQNPDRWWESLSYMIHALWGGLVAASALSGYEHLSKTEYLLAAYRATVAVFYCYDWHATATRNKLGPGEAASTYSVAGPNLNRPDLSRNRFGQSAFTAADGAIFARLFQDDAGYDWDMGEELVAYLAGFGTKTYLYYRDGDIGCVNGEVSKDGDRWIVRSYAAYPTEFYFYEENASYRLQPDEKLGRIVYAKGRFVNEAVDME
jgi:hypothetical protein